MNSKSIFKIKYLSKAAKINYPAHPGDVGYDVFTPEDVRIGPLNREVIGLKMSIELPKGYFAIVQGKSGLAANNGLTTIGNIIDNSYRGEIHVILLNLSWTYVMIPAGSKIAQLLILPYSTPPLKRVAKLSSTSRGAGKMGSTGLR